MCCRQTPTPTSTPTPTPIPTPAKDPLYQTLLKWSRFYFLLSLQCLLAAQQQQHMWQHQRRTFAPKIDRALSHSCNTFAAPTATCNIQHAACSMQHPAAHVAVPFPSAGPFPIHFHFQISNRNFWRRNRMFWRLFSLRQGIKGMKATKCSLRKEKN